MYTSINKTTITTSPTTPTQFTYKISSTQLKFLQLLSNKATQKLTYHCKASSAFFDEQTKTHDKALHLVSHNHKLLQSFSKRFNYHVTLDECRVGVVCFVYELCVIGCVCVNLSMLFAMCVYITVVRRTC